MGWVLWGENGVIGLTMLALGLHWPGPHTDEPNAKKPDLATDATARQGTGQRLRAATGSRVQDGSGDSYGQC